MILQINKFIFEIKDFLFSLIIERIFYLQFINKKIISVRRYNEEL